jgi:hypothetical protein
MPTDLRAPCAFKGATVLTGPVRRRHLESTIDVATPPVTTGLAGKFTMPPLWPLCVGRHRCSPLGFPVRRSLPSTTEADRLSHHHRTCKRPSPQRHESPFARAVCSGCRWLIPPFPRRSPPSSLWSTPRVTGSQLHIYPICASAI